MSVVLHLPMHSIPAVISQSVRDVLAVHGIILPCAVLAELGNNVTQALFSIDQNPANGSES